MIAAGIGCRSGCPTEDVVAAIARAAAASGVALGEVHALYSAEFKADELGLRQAAEALAKPLVLLPQAALAAHAGAAVTCSPHAFARFALPSVAETAALAGAFELAGHRGTLRLLGPRQAMGAATCALARAEAGA